MTGCYRVKASKTLAGWLKPKLEGRLVIGLPEVER